MSQHQSLDQMQAFLLQNGFDTRKQMEKHERFLRARGKSGILSGTFVDNTDVISEDLARKVTAKAIQFKVTCSHKTTPDGIYYGQGGLILTESEIQRKRKRGYDNFLTTVIVTARHNLECEDSETREIVLLVHSRVNFRG